MPSDLATLQTIINHAHRLVFFGGAGVSTESGIPDFRSVDGLYHQKYDYPPETILSHTFWEENPEEFYRFYRDKLIVKGAKPNAAHLRLAKLEQQGKLRAVVTQNIDGLHQAAGSKTVYELHGSTLRNYCTRCGKFYDVDFIANSTGVPRCTECGGIVKPEDIPGFAKNIRDEAGRMITLIQDILKLSQLDENTFSDQRERVDLYELAQSAAERLRPQADEKHVTISVTGERSEFTGIASVLEVMIYNLLDDAV